MSTWATHYPFIKYVREADLRQPPAKAVLYAIEGHINAQGEARLAMATIAHEAGIGERWARRLIARLRSADLLLVEYPVGQVPCYRFPVIH